MTEDRVCRRAVIKGRVQGVNYRAWTQARASALGLAGWVRNRLDGSVEAVFQGPQNAVEKMLSDCADGPMHAQVTSVEAEPWPPVPGSEFIRLPTA